MSHEGAVEQQTSEELNAAIIGKCAVAPLDSFELAHEIDDLFAESDREVRAILHQFCDELGVKGSQQAAEEL